MPDPDAQKLAPFDVVETLIERDGFEAGSLGTVVDVLQGDALLIELEGDATLALPAYFPTELRLIKRRPLDRDE